MNMCFVCLHFLPYVQILLLIFLTLVTTTTQNYADDNHYSSNRGYLPPPIYQDSSDYVDNNQYSDYVAPQNDPLNRNSWSIAHQPQYNVNAAINKFNYTPTSVSDWPQSGVTLGQVSAVSLDSNNRVYVFHRATHRWDQNTFTKTNRYRNINEPPISLPTIIVFNSSSGAVIEQWGQNIFYMPHGLTVDNKNNIWVTDVALHQVMKFPAGEKETPSLILGVRFTPGNNECFCKPSGVAVMESGDFFVSDGYCNTRIIKYSAVGKKILQWGRNSFQGIQPVIPQPYSFAVPHALALAEDKELLCVADRENGRVQCFNCHNGTFVSQYHSPIIGARLFSVAYSPIKGGQLYVVNGPDYTERRIRGFVINIESSKIMSQFGPDNKDFSNPHDIAVSKNGKEVYVVELDPYKIHKFIDNTVLNDKEYDNRTKKISKQVDKSINKSILTSTSIPVKPTATIEGLSLVGNNWGGWAGVAGGVAGGLGAVLLLLLGGAALLLRAKHRGGTTLIPEKECLVL